jgi:hypothetical protein
MEHGRHHIQFSWYFSGVKISVLGARIAVVFNGLCCDRPDILLLALPRGYFGDAFMVVTSLTGFAQTDWKARGGSLLCSPHLLAVRVSIRRKTEKTQRI